MKVFLIDGVEVTIDTTDVKLIPSILSKLLNRVNLQTELWGSIKGKSIYVYNSITKSVSKEEPKQLKGLLTQCLLGNHLVSNSDVVEGLDKGTPIRLEMYPDDYLMVATSKANLVKFMKANIDSLFSDIK